MNWGLLCLTFVFFVSTTTAHFSIPGLPIVRVPEYTAIGFKNTTAKGTTANLYLGLPFAKPPIGNLRFEKTQPLSPNLFKVVKATSWPQACHQVIDARALGINSSEDCLYLNVMTPSKSSKKLLPVFVFIHGGGYAYGYSQAYGFEYFVDNFVSKDIIMVTLQYRLAHFGFFATRDHEINGNFGHFDQLEALKFIKRNIRAFGGDPNQITLSGHSAGSTSVHALSLSPKARNLYNQEVHVAGSNYALWGIDNAIVFNQSDIISTAVGCSQLDTKQRKICLKNTPYESFWQARKDLNLFDFPPNQIDMFYWTAVFDNDFFEGKTLNELQSESPKRKTLYGIDSLEGLLLTLYTDNPITNVFAISRGFTFDNRTSATAETIRDFLPQLLTDSKFTPALKEEIMDKIFEFYKIGGQYDTFPLHYFDKYSELYTDILLKAPIGKEIEAKLQYDWADQYMYIFDYVRPIDRPIIGDKPGHGYFLLYFCGLDIYTSNGASNTPEDIEIQKNLAEMFSTFVKNSVPTSNGTTISKVTTNSIPYMQFKPEVVIGNTDVKPKVDFWNQLSNEYNYDFIRQVSL